MTEPMLFWPLTACAGGEIPETRRRMALEGNGVEAGGVRDWQWLALVCPRVGSGLVQESLAKSADVRLAS